MPGARAVRHGRSGHGYAAAMTATGGPRPDGQPHADEPVPGLEQLPEADRAQVLDAARRVRVPAGWTPVHDRTPGDKTYLVLTGAFTVWHDGERLATIGPGELAGEVAPVHHRLRTATLVADGPVEALAWPRAELDRLRMALPAFGELVAASSARHGWPA